MVENVYVEKVRKSTKKKPKKNLINFPYISENHETFAEKNIHSIIDRNDTHHWHNLIHNLFIELLKWAKLTGHKRIYVLWSIKIMALLKINCKYCEWWSYHTNHHPMYQYERTHVPILINHMDESSASLNQWL